METVNVSYEELEGPSMTQEEGYIEAEKLIRQAAYRYEPFLALNKLQLSSVPESIGDLTQLTSLFSISKLKSTNEQLSNWEECQARTLLRQFQPIKKKR